MADLSDAHGTISVVIMTPGKEEAFEEFWKAIGKTQKGEYSFSFVDEDLDCETVSFYGTGYWAFTDNLEYFGSWAADVLNAQKDTETLSFLEGLEFSLTFEYTDYESGNNCFYRATDVVYHKADTPLEQAEFECVYDTNIEKCAFNIVRNDYAESYMDWFINEWANEYNQYTGKFELEYEEELESMKDDLKKSIIAYMGRKPLSRSDIPKIKEEFKDYKRFTYEGKTLIINEVLIRESLVAA